MMVATPKKAKAAKVAPIEVDGEHQAMIAVLVDTYGTYINVVHKALDLLWARDKSGHQPPSSNP